MFSRKSKIIQEKLVPEISSVITVQKINDHINGIVSMQQQHWPEMATWMYDKVKYQSLDTSYCFQLKKKRETTTWQMNAYRFSNRKDKKLLILGNISVIIYNEFSVDLVIFTDETLNRKLQFLFRVNYFMILFYFSWM